MALTTLQREICRLLADQRRASGESYVAGGAALNELLAAPRVSRDLDLFHDTTEALDATWAADRRTLEASGFDVRLVRERSGYVEAEVSRGADTVLMQWARDSAFRFFPLVEHPDFGLTLHPFDLATNKLLALVGRLEARDWVDVIRCHDDVQPLGFLAWAASGKDATFSPTAILEEVSRTSRYSEQELKELAFTGEAPDAMELARRWRGLLAQARAIVATLPAQTAGRCVLQAGGELFRGDLPALEDALHRHALIFHEGRIRGAYPQVLPGGNKTEGQR